MRKPKAPKPDYGALWRSYDKWQQEDRMWYEARKAEQAKGTDTASAKARMSAAGLEAGSQAWNRQLRDIERARPNIDKEYADKQKKLTSSLVYRDLQEEYKKQELRRRGDEADKWVGEARDAARKILYQNSDNGYVERLTSEEMGDLIDKYNLGDSGVGLFKGDRRGGYYAPSEDGGTRGTEAFRFVSPDEGGYSPQGISLIPMAEQLNFKFKERSFDEWGAQSFGRQKVANPYAEAPLTKEEKAMARARVGASGRQEKSLGAAQAIRAYQESPWM